MVVTLLCIGPLLQLGCQPTESIDHYRVRRLSDRDTTVTGASVGPRSDDLRYEAPLGWTPGRTGGMRKAAFEVVDAGRKVEITVIDLARAGGDFLANVNRWRGQLDLPETTPDELKRETSKIEVDGSEGIFVELESAAEASRREMILGAIIPHSDKTWFFKLRGDRGLAEREKEQFLAFIRTVRFATAEGTGNGQ